MEKDNIRYLQGRYKCFVLKALNYCRTKILLTVDGKIYDVDNRDLRYMPYWLCFIVLL